MKSRRVESPSFPMPEKDEPRPFPEDFAMRGLLWTANLFPENWFANGKIDDEEKYLELPSMATERRERIVWLAFRIVANGSLLKFSKEDQAFYVGTTVETERESSRESGTMSPFDHDESLKMDIIAPSSRSSTWASRTTLGDDETRSFRRTGTELTELTEADESDPDEDMEYIYTEDVVDAPVVGGHNNEENGKGMLGHNSHHVRIAGRGGKAVGHRDDDR